MPLDASPGIGTNPEGPYVRKSGFPHVRVENSDVARGTHAVDGRRVQVQDVNMRRLAGAFTLLFVASLLLASYGHCWPMLAAQMDRHIASHDAHHHGGHEKQHHHPTEGFGQELSVPAVQTAAPALADQPAAKSFPPLVLVVAVEKPHFDARTHLNHRARAGPPAFAEFHARTGRLLI